ncbi:MAG TPA: 4-oxalomesaconate tautomerase [Bryobacteraceae bacterium]|jgi:4-oxalomesaconate tautomerase|nr:4-oxalomesaconate tautomerase [Bryobacteraceae bacterium]
MMAQRQLPIRCALMRGGTSKGAYFLAEDLPESPAARDAMLLSIMGSPDPTQIDGVGGGHSLRSKVAIVQRSTEDGVNVDFLFAQVAVDRASVDTSPNCGNILAGVGPFAIERKLVEPRDGTTRVRVRILNTGSVADLDVETPGGVVTYAGDAAIAGVPGTGSPIRIGFRNVEGSVCGSLLPTGRARDQVEGVAVTCIDNGMPVVLVAARSLDRSGLESVEQLNNDSELKRRLESIRLAAGALMNLGDVSGRVVPKVSLVAPAANGGCVLTRNFIPKVCHTAIGVFAAVSVASACVLPGSVTDGIARVPDEDQQLLSIEHPTGEFTVHLDVDRSGALPHFRSVGLLRTARMLFDGTVFAHSDYRDRNQEAL